MTENSKIEWTHHTFNPWIGCTKVSPGCDNCYAESMMDTRLGSVKWGAGNPRKLTSLSNWKMPLIWNARAGAAHERHRVFCASLADIFDNEVPEEWRKRVWEMIRLTPNLDWLLLTKRIGNAAQMLPPDFMHTPWHNVWMGISVVNQEEAERDIPKLCAINAKVRFLSIEPMLDTIDLTALKTPYDGTFNALMHDRINWVIVGGESGNKARPMHPLWAQNVNRACVTFQVPFLFKQWGEWVPGNHSRDLGILPAITENLIMIEGTMGNPDVASMFKVGKHRAGRLLDGREWNEYPTVRL